MKKESTPFVEIAILNKIKGHRIAWIHLYWSSNAGVYGHQVISEYNYGDYEKNYTRNKTSGCGYCKEAEALQEALSDILGGRAYTCHYRASSLLHKHRKGGNYYELSMGQLRKAIKAVK